MTCSRVCAPYSTKVSYVEYGKAKPVSHVPRAATAKQRNGVKRTSTDKPAVNSQR